MRKKYIVVALAIFFFFNAVSQNNNKVTDRIKVFIDCSNTNCDMSFIRTEINLVDFLLDRIAADVHMLVTEQGTGSGGSKYQLIFFGQNRFKNQQDTFHFNTDPNATDFENRDVLIKYMKLGLASYIAKTSAARDVVISFKGTETSGQKADPANKPAHDPWNYWVFRIGANGNINAEEVYKDRRYNAEFSVDRVTEEMKTGFSAEVSKNKSIFEYEDSSGTQKIIVKNHNYELSQYYVKSINTHWSIGYEARYSQSSFSNKKGQAFVRAAIEYNIFPYKEVNNRYFTIGYGITARNNRYYDSTIYNKIQETLIGHRAEARISFNQKWGSSFLGINYHNYFHDWKLFNLGINASTNVRITGGLSFNIYLYGALTRDQINLAKGGATEQEILTRRRQVASGYSYYTSFGLNYRFGSKLNNFVNPRFEGPNN